MITRMKKLVKVVSNKKEFDENYPFDDCDVCGSNVFKKRIKL